MPEMPEPEDTSERQRLIQHRLLDLLTMMDGAGEETPQAAVDVVTRELSELGAVALIYDHEDTDETRHVQITPLIAAAAALLELLIGHAAENAGVDRLAMINTVRAVVDDIASE